MNSTTNKKQILFIGGFDLDNKIPSTGGQAFACQSLIKSDLKKKYDFHLIDTTANLNFKESFLFKLFKSLKRTVLLINKLLTNKIDIILIFSSNGFSFKEKCIHALIGKLIFRKKIVFAPRSGRLQPELNQSDWLFKVLLRKIDVLICQSDYWKSFFSTHTPYSHKLIVVKNWIDLNKYQEKYALSDSSKITFLFLGSLERDKGIYDLLEGIKLIEPQMSFNLIIAGSGSEIDNVLKRIELLSLESIVQLLGWVKGETKYNLLADSDVLILPSYFEGSPNVILEAMCSGMGIISTNVGAIPDILDHENGKIVNPGDIQMLSKAIKDYLNEPELISKHGKVSKNKILKYHTVENAADKFDKIFEGLSK